MDSGVFVASTSHKEFFTQKRLKTEWNSCNTKSEKAKQSAIARWDDQCERNANAMLLKIQNQIQKKKKIKT